MPKRPKEVRKIEVDLLDEREEDEPECYGEWEDTCDRELCGEFYDKCKYHTETEPF